jgi:hypothetical protein
MSLPSLQEMVNRVALTDHDLLLAGHYFAGFQVQLETLLHIQDHPVYNLHSACVMQKTSAHFHSVRGITMDSENKDMREYP